MASRVTVAKSKLTAIADSIRAKANNEDMLKLDDMPIVISELNTELVCEIDFTKGQDCVDKVSGRKASWRSINWDRYERYGAGFTATQSAIWLPVNFVKNADTFIELDISEFDLSTSGTMQSLVAIGDGYQAKGVGYHNGVWALKDDDANILDTDNSDFSILNNKTVTIEVNRYGYISMYDEDGTEIIRQKQYPYYRDFSIFLGGYHSDTYGSLKNMYIKAVRVYHRLSPDFNKINKLVYGFTDENNYVENAIPYLSLDKGIDYRDYLSYDSSTRKFTALQDFDAHIILETFEYKSASSNPQGELYINDVVELKHEYNWTNLGRPMGACFQSGGNFSLKQGDVIYPKNPSSGGYALERVHIYQIAEQSKGSKMLEEIKDNYSNVEHIKTLAEVVEDVADKYDVETYRSTSEPSAEQGNENDIYIEQWDIREHIDLTDVQYIKWSIHDTLDSNHPKVEASEFSLFDDEENTYVWIDATVTTGLDSNDVAKVADNVTTEEFKGYKFFETVTNRDIIINVPSGIDMTKWNHYAYYTGLHPEAFPNSWAIALSNNGNDWIYVENVGINPTRNTYSRAFLPREIEYIRAKDIYIKRNGSWVNIEDYI